jgi:hypothetical protein
VAKRVGFGADATRVASSRKTRTGTTELKAKELAERAGFEPDSTL